MRDRRLAVDPHFRRVRRQRFDSNQRSWIGAIGEDRFWFMGACAGLHLGRNLDIQIERIDLIAGNPAGLTGYPG